MKTILSSVLRHLESGEDAVLCRILSASGSTPRGAGAAMAVFPDGATLGTVGGGAIEAAARQQALELLASGRSLLRSYALHSNTAADLGMICGGDVQILFQFLDHRDEFSRRLLQSATAMLGRNCSGWLILCLRDGAIVDAGLYSDDEGLQFLHTLPENAVTPLLKHAAILKEGPVTIYTEPLCRRGRVLIFGCGHVGTALAPVLPPLGFRVTVLDSRPHLADPARFPEAVTVSLCDFDRIREAVTLAADDYCVVMTPGHERDLAVLTQVLRSPAAYIGCIGSRKKIARTRELLLEAGFTEDDLARIHAPIGLPIGAETPEEIAISVASELIAFRAGKINQ